MSGQAKGKGWARRLARLAGILLLTVGMALVALIVNQRLAVHRVRQTYPAPGRLIPVDGHLMHLNCQGAGQPLVVVDAGNSSFSLEWTPIQAELSQLTRVCTFDRPGYGWSEPGLEPRGGAQVVAELHALLAAAGEPGPYLLVGHSLGGVHVRQFALQYPEETAGLILIDTVSPLVVDDALRAQIGAANGFYQVMGLLTGSGIMRVLGPLGGADSMPETARKLPADLQPAYLNLLLDPVQYRTAIAEMNQLPETITTLAQQLPAAPAFGDLPLLVLTAGLTSAPGSTPFAATAVPVTAARLAAQADLAASSTRGEQRVLATSGHLVHLDAPEAVVQAVSDMVAAIR